MSMIGSSISASQRATLTKLNGVQATAVEIDGVIKKNIYLSGTDVTAQIQNAIDTHKYIHLIGVGEYAISDSLVMPSNSSISMDTAVIITNNHSGFMIINSDTINGNEAIKISGTFDCKLMPTVGGYVGHNLFFHKVNNLSYVNLTLKNSLKYASLVVDCDGFYSNNVFLSTNSDGLHFQPPLSNASINNIYGTTGDDMIAFTLGDYIAYQVSNVGNFEDISINNVFPNGAKAVLKITGSGNGGAYYFKNIHLANVYGTCTYSPIAIIDDGVYLQATRPLNVSISNMNVKSTNAYPTVSITSTGGGNVSVKNCSSHSHKFFSSSVATVLDELVISGLLNVEPLIATSIDVLGNIKRVFINDTTCNTNNKNFFKTAGVHEVIVFSEIRILGSANTADRFIDFSGTCPIIQVSNLYIEKVAYILSAIYDTLLEASNVYIKDITSGTAFYANNATLTIRGNNILSNAAFGNYTAGTGVLKVDCRDMNVTSTIKLTGRLGDEVSVSDVRYRHNGTAWATLA